MLPNPQKQPAPDAFSGTVNVEHLTVDYWRERFAVAFKEWRDIGEVADALAKEDDPLFQHAAGVLLLLRIQTKKVRRPIPYARAVQLMEKLRPIKPLLAPSLSRQKLKID